MPMPRLIHYTMKYDLPLKNMRGTARQDSVATSVAEKWIEACCSKFKAEFDLLYSIVKNVACAPRRPHPEAKPFEGDNESRIRYLTTD
jgi:hypothetical protein